MFTKDQLKQLQQLLQPLYDGLQELRTGQDELRLGQDELRLGQDELRSGQDHLRLDLDELRKGFLSHEKTLKYIKNKLNKTHKTVEIMSRRYNEEIVDNRRRIQRLEDVVGITPHKH